MCPFYNNHENTQQENTLFRIKVKEMMEEKEIEAAARIMEEIITCSTLEHRDIVFLCIGSDRYVGDSLGPLVGTMLRESHVPYHVYGTLKEPVHAFNLKDILKDINKQLKKPLIISIDACLGEKSQVGFMIFNKGPLAPGKALEKILPEVGDYHIKGVVNYIDPLPASQFINDTRLYTVFNFARTIVKIIRLTVQ
ncbi:spore protease YyaC [Bacillus sp. UNC41MFS5]|uniref:spore protease YyaC n=1 Tax=Bacillus sp. UNC41MFS5 TaxID=1449046 RepID=UPI000B01DD51|nr:spore protease YyaC [Bacillus sp. UNC41MFS5]